MSDSGNFKAVDSETPSVTQIIKQLCPDSTDLVISLLNKMQSSGCRFFLFNLPVHYHDDKAPTDLDILLDPKSYLIAVDLFNEHGLIALDRRVGSQQKVFVLRMQGRGFVRLHVHADLCFLGLQLLKYDRISAYLKQLGEFQVPSPELDFVLLHLQWFFKRKTRYPDRIRQLERQVDKDILESMMPEVCDDRTVFVEQLFKDCRDGRTITRLGQTGTLLRHFPFQVGPHLSILAKLANRLKPKLFGRRRGLFVYLMGIDGAGKTTIATSLKQSHDQGGFVAQSEYLGLKNMLVQRVRSRLIKQNERERFDGQSGVADKLAKRSSLASNLFNLGISLVYLAEYLFKGFRLLRFVREENNLIIVDRGYYDKLTERHRWGNNMFFHLLPRPDLVVALHGDLQVLYERKQEFEVDVLFRMQNQMDDAWRFLEANRVSVCRIDSVRLDIADCVEDINARLWTMAMDRVGCRLNPSSNGGERL